MQGGFGKERCWTRVVGVDPRDLQGDGTILTLEPIDFNVVAYPQLQFFGEFAGNRQAASQRGTKRSVLSPLRMRIGTER